MGRPADKGCVEDIGPFGMVVLELALEGDGGHEVLWGVMRGVS